MPGNSNKISYQPRTSIPISMPFNPATSGLDAVISDEAYGPSWNGVTDVAPSKNTVYDKIETISGSVPDPVTFTAQTDVPPSTLTTSNTETINGAANQVWPVTIRGDGEPQLQVNAQDWAIDGLVRDGDGLTVRLTSSDVSEEEFVASVCLPGSTASFSVTTQEIIASVIDVLVVGGGGGGGAAYGGGGGAGGYIYETDYSIMTTAYPVTVGGGGAGSAAVDTANVATNGDDSVFDVLTAIGGGGGPGYLPNNQAGSAGGSGSGGILGGAGGGATSGQGHAGGTGSGSANYGGGGGGGASAVGSNGSTTNGGNGGAGTANSITGGSVTYAGGGGGSVWNSGTPGSGGAGGGGNGGAANGSGSNGTANTGGGGGGGGFSAVTYAGGNGGSGIVIIRYLTADFGSCTGGTITTDGAYTIHTFTTDGTFTAVAV